MTTRGLGGVGLMLACALGAAAPGCAESLTETGVLKARSPASHAITTLPLVVLPLVDARPAIMRQEHVAARSGMGGFVLGYIIAFGAETVTGPDVIGDANTKLEVNGRRGPGPAQQVDQFLADVIAAAAGTPVIRPTAAVALDRIDGAAAAVPGGNGTFVLPVLDQLDVISMRSEYFLLGGGSSSSTSGGTTTTTTTSGTVSTLAKTPRFANARIRLILGEVQAGKLVRTSALYAAGAASDLDDAVDVACKQISKGAVAFLVGNRRP